MTKSLVTEGNVERCISLLWRGLGIEHSMGEKGEKRTSKTVKPMKTKSAVEQNTWKEKYFCFHNKWAKVKGCEGWKGNANLTSGVEVSRETVEMDSNFSSTHLI